MWTDEASGMYSPYLSIAEEGTSPRAHFIKKFYFLSKIFSYSIIYFIFCASVLDKNVLL